MGIFIQFFVLTLTSSLLFLPFYGQDDAEPQIIPVIEIDSVSPEGDSAYVIELRYLNPNLISGLRIRVVERQSNIVVYDSRLTGVRNIVSIPNSEFERDTDYRLYVIGEDANNRTLQYSSESSRGDVTLNTVQAVREFSHRPRIAETIVEINSVNFDAELQAFVLQLDQSNVDSIATYAVWLENQRTQVRLNANDLVFSAPRDQISIQMQEAQAGTYRIIIEGRATDGTTVITRTMREGLVFDRPNPSLFQRLRNSPFAMLLVGGVLISAVSLLFVSTSNQRRSSQNGTPFYVATGGHRGDLITERDETIHRFDRKDRIQGRKQRASQISAYLTIADGPGEYYGQKYHINRETFTIGREGQDITLADKVVSRVHLVIVHENGRFYAEDLRSHNGTYLNGKKITGKGRNFLKDGDNLKIAKKFTLRFEQGRTHSK